MPLYCIAVKSNDQWEEIAQVVAIDNADAYAELLLHLQPQHVGKPISFKRAERGGGRLRWLIQ